jgi:hypothetical protein
MDGGSGYAAIPAGSGTSAVVVKAAPGKLVRVIVITLGTAAMSFYDNPAAASGTRRNRLRTAYSGNGRDLRWGRFQQPGRRRNVLLTSTH